MRKEKHQLKTCPFYDEVCKKQGCQIYNERLDNCDISVVSYNLYRLFEELAKYNEKPILK